MPANIDALFKPRTVAFVGGSNLNPILKYHRDLGFAGTTWVVNPKYKELQGFACVPSIDDLPAAPDLAFVAIRSEAAVAVIAALRDKGCRAVICHAGGFAESGGAGEDLQAQLVAAAGDMAMLGPNTIGFVNFVDPMAAAMDHFGVQRVERGVAICSQGGGFMCDAVFCDRGLNITHLVGGGNQAALGIESCLDYLLDDARVTAVGLAFEGLRDMTTLRRVAAKALRIGKPIVAIKFGRTQEGAQASASHTASMTGSDAAWLALFDRLGIIATESESEFFETLKLIDTAPLPKGRRVMATAASGVMGIMLADRLSAGGFEMPQPSGARVARLREVLPAIATPCNPQDVTMVVWNDREQQAAIYSALIDEGYDIAMMGQNYPRAGMWDIGEYRAQVEGLAAACEGREVTAVTVAPMVDCFPAEERAHVQQCGMAAMQGLDECVRALSHAVWWRERREVLLAEGVADWDAVPTAEAKRVSSSRCSENVAKAMLAKAGVAVPASRVTAAEDAAAAAEALGFPVVVKALDARLLHKSEVGAVRVGLASSQAVADAVSQMRQDMARHVPDIPLSQVLVEAMVADGVAEVMASVSVDESAGALMMIAGGGSEAELWNDKTFIAAPFNAAEITRALSRLKISARLNGWRGQPAADTPALVALLERLAAFALDNQAQEVEVNPIIVGRTGAWAVDALLQFASYISPTEDTA